MSQGMRLIVYPVHDLAQAKRLYGTLLGVEPYVDGSYYVGFRVGDQEIGLDPNGHSSGLTGPLGYWTVDNIQQAVQALVDAGAQVQQAVRDVGGGMLIAWVKDADGNITGLRQIPQRRTEDIAPMKYMLLFYWNEATVPANVSELYQAWQDVSKDAAAAGVLLSRNGLKPVSNATTVRVHDGKTLTTDGPFAETHEQLGGYFLVDCKDLDEAVAWAAKIPTAWYGSVEIRPLWDQQT